MKFSRNLMSTNQSSALLLMNFSTIPLKFVDFEDTFTDIICVNNQSE